MQVIEIWKDCKRFEDYYECSNLGKIRRKKGVTIYKNGVEARFSQTILKHSLNKKGYHKVYLSVKSKKYSRYVHRLVAETFILNPENKKTVNHKDCNKDNNNVSNLEWMTNKENMQHAFKNGVFKERNKTAIFNIKHMRDKLNKQ